MAILWCDTEDGRKDLGVITAEGDAWIYFGIEETCWAMNKRDGRVNRMRYAPRYQLPHREWRAAKFSTLPPEIQREYLLWKMAK